MFKSNIFHKTQQSPFETRNTDRYTTLSGNLFHKLITLLWNILVSQIFNIRCICFVDRWTVEIWRSPTATRILTATRRCFPTLPNELRTPSWLRLVFGSVRTSAPRCRWIRRDEWCPENTSCSPKCTTAGVAATHRLTDDRPSGRYLT